jgi:hypothetical protein
LVHFACGCGLACEHQRRALWMGSWEDLKTRDKDESDAVWRDWHGGARSTARVSAE